LGRHLSLLAMFLPQVLKQFSQQAVLLLMVLAKFSVQLEIYK